MKRNLILFLVLVLLNSLFSTKATSAFSVTKTQEDYEIETIVNAAESTKVGIVRDELLYDIEGNASFKISYFDNGGYAISVNNTSEIIVFDLFPSKLPFEGFETEKKVFAGPFSYYIDRGNSLIGASSSSKIEVISKKDISAKSKEVLREKLNESRLMNIEKGVRKIKIERYNLKVIL